MSPPPPTDAPWQLSATELAVRIRGRELSCREVLDSCLARIGQVNPQIHALVEVHADAAMQAAAEADRALARGDEVGPLHGVPLSTKVNVDQQGCATTNGVAAYASAVAREDSPVVANLRRAGAIVLGRSNTPAFSIRWFTDNAPHGRTFNPCDRALTPGGSSGGAAAAVAAGMGPIAHGNDQGGSIRYPAYACGVYGLRPSVGRVPAWNPSAAAERPPIIASTSVQGPLARCVADLRLGLQAMAAHDPRDPGWVPAMLQPPRPRTGHPRVALCLPSANADPGVRAALLQAARWLEDAGHAVEEAAPPAMEEAAQLWLDLSMAELRMTLGEAIRSVGDPAIRSAYAAMDAHAQPVDDLATYLRLCGRRNALAREWSRFFERWPLLLLPVSAQRPFPIDLDQAGAGAMRGILDAQAPLLATAILGLPAAAAPVRATGLPQSPPPGVQFVAWRFQDALCLDAAQVLEERQPVLRPIDQVAAAASGAA